jgi:histidyl-tRNA synthetase
MYMSKKYQKPRGMQDWLPDDQKLWGYITETFIDICRSSGAGRISTPILESTELFTRAVGEETEVVSKEMYTFTDRSDNSLTLKPESTAGVVRAYIENGMASMPKPITLYYIEPHFRYERPQAGRYRQHHQLGFEVFGDATSTTDVHVIALGSRLLNNLGIAHKVLINSIGSIEDRQNYIEVLKAYFEEHKDKLPDINKAQLEKNPLRILDTKDEGVMKLVEGAPHIIDYLSKESSARFQSILEMLEGCGIEYELNTRLVRGLDYYNDIVFEYIASREGASFSVGGGGRYDALVSQMDGVDTPAVGFGLGIERIKLELEEMNYAPEIKNPDVFVVAIGKDASVDAEVMLEKLLNAGISARSNFSKKSMGDQLALAAKLGVKYSVVIGDREAQQKEVIIKDMASGNQQVDKQDKLIDNIKNSLGA